VSVVQRPSWEEFADALSAQYTSKCDVDILPTKLRPVKIKDENYFAISEESDDNIIINLSKLSGVDFSIFATWMSKCLHKCKSGEATGSVHNA
jgi:hypothetical protein